MIADMHCDTISEILSHREKGEKINLRENNLHIDLKRMQKSGYLVQNFALFVEKSRVYDPWQQVCRLAEVYKEELSANQDLIAPALNGADIWENHKRGLMSALLTVEEGAVCKGDIGRLETLYDMGVRMLTLTWNYPNELGFPNLNKEEHQQTPDTRRGLTHRGLEFVERMEELGMIPDVSHLSDAGFFDVLKVAKKPFVASHTNARSICPCVRNMTDEMIKSLGERGGVMGLNFYANFLEEKLDGVYNPGTLEAVVRHAKHIVKVGGIEILGLGSDFDGIKTNEALPGAQSMGKLAEALLQSGFHESELDKILYGNVMRVYGECL